MSIEKNLEKNIEALGLDKETVAKVREASKLYAKRLKLLRKLQVSRLRRFAARHRDKQTGTWDSRKNLADFKRMIFAIDKTTAKVRVYYKERKFSYDPY